MIQRDLLRRTAYVDANPSMPAGVSTSLFVQLLFSPPLHCNLVGVGVDLFLPELRPINTPDLIWREDHVLPSC